MDKEILEVLEYFDIKTKEKIINSDFLKDKPTEIRLRLNQNIILNINKQNIIIKNYIITNEILSDIFYRMCEFSYNAYEKEISNGFIILKGGHRVGIGGVFINDKTQVLKKLTSLNIRILYSTNTFFNISDFDFNKGILIIGAPHTGKTTLLKNIISKLSIKNNVCVCDEREELVLKNQNFDSIKRIKKAVAIEMATRTLNPDIIICDEIGDKKETKAILSSVNTGVKFICTAHGNSFLDIKKRPNINTLLKNNIFDKIIILEKNIYKIKEIIDV